MITLTLLHPIQSIPVQSWTFEHETVIRIGRSTDNHVILYSAVVSRHHVELHCIDSQWEVVSLGANGTYVDGKRITQMPIVDSLVIRLARSGPNIQIHVGSFSADSLPAGSSKTLQGDHTLAQRKSVSGLPSSGGAPLLPNLAIPVTRQPDDDSAPLDPSFPGSPDQVSEALITPAADMDAMNGASVPEPSAIAPVTCTHPRAQGNVLFCPDCGQPLQFTQTVGAYQVVKTVRQDTIGVTQLVWRDGQSLVLRALKPDWQKPAVIDAFTQQAKQLLTLNHPGLPRFVDFFSVEGTPYLVRQRAYGQSLQQQVSRRGVLTPTEAIATIVQVCNTLDYLHQQSPPVFHEDLKPENLIKPAIAAGTITIVGFLSLQSLAASQGSPSDGDASEGNPSEGSPSGSPSDGLASDGLASERTRTASYLAPEQAQGQKSAAADLFALGPLLVYLLTGQAPAAFYAQREQGFRFYPEYVPGLPTELVAIVRRLTSPQPDERYATATEVAAALLQLASSE